MKVENEIKRLREQLKAQAKDIRQKIKFLQEHAKPLESLPEANFCGNRLDFDCLPHPEVIRVVRSLGGKWKKSKNESANPGKTKIDYEAQMGEIFVRCWGGDPPPSCRLVEVEEDVPEQVIPAKVIPAHKKKVLKMICTGHNEPLIEAIAKNQAPPVQS